MTVPPRPGRYDWGQPPEPVGIPRWVADHRRLTRSVLVIFDAALVVVLASGLISGDNHWYSYLQLPIWAWLTVQFGWLMPKRVDDWRRARDGSRD